MNKIQEEATVKELDLNRQLVAKQMELQAKDKILSEMNEKTDEMVRELEEEMATSADQITRLLEENGSLSNQLETLLIKERDRLTKIKLQNQKLKQNYRSRRVILVVYHLLKHKKILLLLLNLRVC